jgi:uncharacterized protein (DUF58 family)
MTQELEPIQQRAERLAGRLPPLLIAAEQVAATVAQGVHGRRRVGQGEAFWQFRRYQPGDPAQAIDWRQSAKSQPLFVRENEWEAAQSVWLWRDSSPSMRYRSSKGLAEKGERADLLLLALASLLVRGGEHIALLGETMVPARGRSALDRVAHSLTRPAPAGPSLPPYDSLPRHAQIVFIGDFLSPLGDIEGLIRRFASRDVKGHLLQVLDPAEETLPFGGRIRFEGMEGEGTVLIPRVEAVRRDYIARIADHREGLAALAGAAGWSFAGHRTDRPPESALLTLYVGLSTRPGA